MRSSKLDKKVKNQTPKVLIRLNWQEMKKDKAMSLNKVFRSKKHK